MTFFLYHTLFPPGFFSVSFPQQDYFPITSNRNMTFKIKILHKTYKKKTLLIQIFRLNEKYDF